MPRRSDGVRRAVVAIRPPPRPRRHRRRCFGPLRPRRLPRSACAESSSARPALAPRPPRPSARPRRCHAGAPSHGPLHDRPSRHRSRPSPAHDPSQSRRPVPQSQPRRLADRRRRLETAPLAFASPHRSCSRSSSRSRLPGSSSSRRAELQPVQVVAQLAAWQASSAPNAASAAGSADQHAASHATSVHSARQRSAAAAPWAP